MPKYRSETFLRAMELKRAGGRGKGNQISDDDLITYIQRARAADGEASSAQLLEIAYWVDGYSMSRGRWVKAWEMADAVSAE